MAFTVYDVIPGRGEARPFGPSRNDGDLLRN